MISKKDLPVNQADRFYMDLAHALERRISINLNLANGLRQHLKSVAQPEEMFHISRSITEYTKIVRELRKVRKETDHIFNLHNR